MPRWWLRTSRVRRHLLLRVSLARWPRLSRVRLPLGVLRVLSGPHVGPLGSRTTSTRSSSDWDSTSTSRHCTPAATRVVHAAANRRPVHGRGDLLRVGATRAGPRRVLLSHVRHALVHRVVLAVAMQRVRGLQQLIERGRGSTLLAQARSRKETLRRRAAVRARRVAGHHGARAGPLRSPHGPHRGPWALRIAGSHVLLVVMLVELALSRVVGVPR